MVFYKDKLLKKLTSHTDISVVLVPVQYEPVLSSIISVEREVFRSRDDPISRLFMRPTSCSRVSSSFRVRILCGSKLKALLSGDLPSDGMILNSLNTGPAAWDRTW